ncbi:hypothetical protein RJT34_04627 [Clitoria ternatea]|uniref:Uncharacterized protein n=1 Tax=Clitoria ternatea TaxID=43366 RepID=A0AAN9KQ50_CLITE
MFDRFMRLAWFQTFLAHGNFGSKEEEDLETAQHYDTRKDPLAGKQGKAQMGPQKYKTKNSEILENVNEPIPNGAVSINPNADSYARQRCSRSTAFNRKVKHSHLIENTVFVVNSPFIIFVLWFLFTLQLEQNKNHTRSNFFSEETLKFFSFT